jgi:hypothetical protein
MGVKGELRSREYSSNKSDSKQRIWEIRVNSILKLDRADKASPKIRMGTMHPGRNRPSRPVLFTLKSLASHRASTSVRSDHEL